MYAMNVNEITKLIPGLGLNC